MAELRVTPSQGGRRVGPGRTHADQRGEHLAAASADDGVRDLVLGDSRDAEHGRGVGVHLDGAAADGSGAEPLQPPWLLPPAAPAPGVGTGLTASFPHSSMALLSTTRLATCLRRAGSRNSSHGRRARWPRQAARSSCSSASSAATSAVPRRRCSAGAGRGRAEGAELLSPPRFAPPQGAPCPTPFSLWAPLVRWGRLPGWSFHSTTDHKAL